MRRFRAPIEDDERSFLYVCAVFQQQWNKKEMV